jgi:hypothetical protein
MSPFTALRKPSPFHFTSLHFTFYFYFFQLSYQPFTSPYFANHIYNSLPFISLHFPSLFPFYRLQFPSLVFTFLTLVLKICVLPLEVPIAPSGSWFQLNCSLTSALEGGVWSASRPGRLYPRERPGTDCTGGWVGPGAGLHWCGKSRPTGIRSPDLPARSESLYRLRYPGSH